VTRATATAMQIADPTPVAAAAVESGSLVQMFERLATNPEVDVVKLERLIAMHERLVAGQAKADFDAAFAVMQGQIPVITEQGQILVEGKLRSRYATNEDIQEVVKPILQAHGFSLRFRHEVTDGWLKVIGILSHRSGHSEHDEFVTRADDSGKKNPIQAIGSARSYGQRYTTTALLNIATRGSDDDGVGTSLMATPVAPAGYDGWLRTFTAAAETGWGTFQAAWSAAPAAYRTYLATHQAALGTTLKTRARAFVASPSTGAA
jgi:hypothetical protein